jgi:wobble nucleotide-excising tRNase
MVKYNVNTSKIEFTLGGFISTISTILVIVLGFYSYVIEPKFYTIEKSMEMMQRERKEMANAINQLNLTVSVLNATVMELKHQTKNEKN